MNENLDKRYTENYISQHRNAILFGMASFFLCIFPNDFELNKIAFIKDDSTLHVIMPLSFLLASIYSYAHFFAEWWDQARTHRRDIRSVVDRVNLDVKSVTAPLHGIAQRAVEIMDREPDRSTNVQEISEELKGKLNYIKVEYEFGIESFKNMILKYEEKISDLRNNVKLFKENIEIYSSQENGISQITRSNIFIDILNLERSIENLEINNDFSGTIFERNSIGEIYDKNVLPLINEYRQQKELQDRLDQHFVEKYQELVANMNEIKSGFDSLKNAPTWHQERMRADSLVNAMRVYWIGMIAPSAILLAAIVANIWFYFFA